MKGCLVAFEGIDTCGKETQAKILIAKLKELGRKTALFSFPRYETEIGREIKKRLRESSETGLGKLYTADFLSAKPEIEKLIGQGYFVVCDRYAASNQAYQGTITEGMPEPSLIIFLDLPPDLAEELKKNRKQKDAYEKNLSFLKKVYQRYKKLARGRNWFRVKCSENEKIFSKEEIAKKIWKIVRELRTPVFFN